MSRNYLAFILLVVATLAIAFGCNHTGKVPPVLPVSDTIVSQSPPPPPQRDIRPDITASSLNLFTLQAPFISPNSKAHRPFKGLDYNKVIAYDYEGAEETKALFIVQDSKLCSTIKQQKSLTQEQVDSVTDFLGTNSTYGAGEAACFEPHLGIVFYKDTTIVLHISICLDCNYLHSSIKIPATEAKKFMIGTESEYAAAGFSKAGRYKLNQLCKELNFSHCKGILDSSFDK
jgi:hypothetical protein